MFSCKRPEFHSQTTTLVGGIRSAGDNTRYCCSTCRSAVPVSFRRRARPIVLAPPRARTGARVQGQGDEYIRTEALGRPCPSTGCERKCQEAAATTPKPDAAKSILTRLGRKLRGKGPHSVCSSRLTNAFTKTVASNTPPYAGNVKNGSQLSSIPASGRPCLPIAPFASEPRTQANNFQNTRAGKYGSDERLLPIR